VNLSYVTVRLSLNLIRFFRLCKSEALQLLPQCWHGPARKNLINLTGTNLGVDVVTGVKLPYGIFWEVKLDDWLLSG
jgi:hypothetical protein